MSAQRKPQPAQPLLERILHPELASLDKYLAAGGFARDHLDPLPAVVALRESGLRLRTHTAGPVFIRWWGFIQQGEDGDLLVDARMRDPESLTESKLLSGDPYGLIEALYLAHLVSGARRVLILLDPLLASLRPRLLDDMDELKRRGLPAGQALELEVTVGAARPQPSEGRPQLVHYLETWYQIKHILAAPETPWGFGGLAPTRLVTVGGRVRRPGLVEVPLGAALSQVLEQAEGLKEPGRVKALALDSGVGGFLPPERADTPLSPEEMMSAGVNPGLGTLWAVGEDRCLVDLTRRALIRLAQIGDHPREASRTLNWHAVRLIIQLSLRKGGPDHLVQLEAIARQLKKMGSPAAWPLVSSLRYFPQEWSEHAQGLSCVAFDCLKPLVAPCHATCPAGIDIPSFLALIGQGRYRQAVEVIRQDNPLPYICGLICPAPCEGICLRGQLDQPIQIRAMKAVAARHALAEGGYPLPAKADPSGQRAAVIGAGPAGLTAAYFLALAGHQVTIFEEQPQAGGTALLGIPAYRLPREVIAAEVQAILDLGVELRTEAALGRDFTLQELRDQGYEAVFLGIGAHQGYSLGLPHEQDYPQVLDAISFLRGVALGGQGAPAEEVVVVGGGNAAMDAARTCRRLGCRVTIAYRRTREEMPAREEEIDDALAEGVRIVFLAVPKEIVGRRGRVEGLRCLRAELGPPDESGRRRPLPVKGSEFVLPAGAIIAAISQRPELSCLGPWADDERLCDRTVLADPATGQTSLGWLFAGGDAVTGPATVVEAVAAGKRAAKAMDAYLKGQAVELSLEFPRPRAFVDPLPVAAAEKTRLRRADIPKLPPQERAQSFALAELGLSDQMALHEAQRCLRCDLCIGCGLCQSACAEVGVQALRLSETPAGRGVLLDFHHAAAACTGCGSCANACPTGAIQLLDDQRTRKVSLAGTVIKELPLVECSRCGRPYLPEAYLDLVAGRLDERHAPTRMQEAICPDCARASGARKRWAGRFASLR
ncbi:MAG: FAD-dependent oxidoreductase [Desulfarculus sp.]|nr:MAG: FAD-dependent oxidoreductase [Desulfarculus sp.]